ncbi:C40 family peptidase [Thermaurantimonas aggregans]|nr:NlpC/P60 family protein [Thermaurantimonas aggregans]
MLNKAISLLSVIPMRKEPSHRSEMVNQILFGELMYVLETKDEEWVKVRLTHDDYQGWVLTEQVSLIDDETFQIHYTDYTGYSADMVDLVLKKNSNHFYSILLGSKIPKMVNGEFTIAGETLVFSGPTVKGVKTRATIIDTALNYLYAPYLWGGRTHFGIDCSGLVQIAYRMAGVSMPRDSYQQATVGMQLSFVEEAMPGDLAFFDDEDGRIIHVGIVLPGKNIIHASGGMVRIDMLDQNGIYRPDLKKYSHRLRVLKNAFDINLKQL